jgi:hypothetical protein
VELTSEGPGPISVRRGGMKLLVIVLLQTASFQKQKAGRCPALADLLQDAVSPVNRPPCRRMRLPPPPDGPPTRCTPSARCHRADSPHFRIRV